MNGWSVFALLAVLETALFAGALSGFGADEPGLRARRCAAEPIPQPA
jgi:hypothetical protein